MVYEHVMGEMMPDSGDNLTAEQTAQLLWLTTDQILNSELMESDDWEKSIEGLEMLASLANQHAQVMCSRSHKS